MNSSTGLEPAEGEPVIRKHRFSSFYHTALNEYMRRAGADTLVVAGLSTGNCQLATAIDGANQDYKIIVLADTTAAIPSGLDDPPRLRPALGSPAPDPGQPRRRPHQQRVPRAHRRLTPGIAWALSRAPAP